MIAIVVIIIPGRFLTSEKDKLPKHNLKLMQSEGVGGCGGGGHGRLNVRCRFASIEFPIINIRRSWTPYLERPGIYSYESIVFLISYDNVY